MKAAAKTIRLDEIPTGKRAVTGKPVIELKNGDEVRDIISISEQIIQKQVPLQPQLEFKKSK